MTEQRTNAAGETVEYNEDSQRWEPVEAKTEEKVEEVEESGESYTSYYNESPNAFDDTPEEDK